MTKTKTDPGQPRPAAPARGRSGKPPAALETPPDWPWPQTGGSYRRDRATGDLTSTEDDGGSSPPPSQ